MIPLRDANPTRRLPVVTLVLILANVVAFVYELQVQSRGQLQLFLQQWALIPASLWGGDSAEFVTLFTAMFLHGGWMHLIGNMLYLWVFGDNIEDQLGSLRFLVFYVVCGLGAAAAQIAIDPTSPIPMLGASGAIAGVLGGYLVLFPRARVLTLVPLIIFYRLMEVPAVLVLGFWFVLQLLNGAAALATVQMQLGGVAFFAHIGGFIVGLALVRLFRPRRPDSWRAFPG